ncbi:2-oxoacid:acceptor oxidoreductase family protein [Endothiovibrio diazotrophicus]
MTTTPKYPGNRAAMDGNTAVIMCERESTDAAGAYPITPSTQMGEYWSVESANGHLNISDRPLIFVEPESEHAAAAVTAGLSMTGLRATNFTSAQGMAFMHESLYTAAGKRLTYVLNLGCRAITKASLNVHCAHDDYHCADDTGLFQVMAKSAQEAADLNLISHRIAELALTPGICAQDGFLTTHLIESLQVPERELVAEYLGRPDDIIDCPTPAQKMLFGPTRRRIPEIWDVDNPVTSGSVQNQDAYMQAVAAQRPYFYAHVPELADRAMAEFTALTGREYKRVGTYKTEDADYVIVGQGSMVVQAEAVADYLRESRGIKVGVVNATLFRPFPGDLMGHALKGKKGVAVLERTDQPMAEDLPLMREIRAAVGKCLENGIIEKGEELPYPGYAAYGIGESPRLYSGCYGLGSRDLQPEGIVAAVENMLPGGKRRKFFYLSVEFVREAAASPKQELHMQELLEAYPTIGELALRGSENPNLMPEGAITVRMHSVGGWGAVTTGKNLAMTLFELLDYDIKANPKYGSEKKGQPTTYYLSAAPTPIRVNCEFNFVDVVLSPDPNVFEHSNAVGGLRKGGVLIIQSNLETPEAVWRSLPLTTRRYIAENEIRLFYLDAFRIARDEASNPELQFRMQGIAFQGAFFRASPVMENAGLNETTLFQAIEHQLESKFGAKGRRVVEDNLRVVRRGFDELFEVTDKRIEAETAAGYRQLRREIKLPKMVRHLPANEHKIADIHRFWEQTGNFYLSGQGSDNLVDPFMGVSLIPASTGLFRDMTQIRFDYPEWNAENCTACGDCYTVCPDSAIPGLVSSIGEVLNTAVERIETSGHPTVHLRRAVRDVEKRLAALVESDGEASEVSTRLREACDQHLAESDLETDAKATLGEELALLLDWIGDYRFAITKPYYTTREKKQKGSGGLFSLTINPYTCKGCMECVEVCGDDALTPRPQTPEAIQRLRDDWSRYLELPNTRKDFIRIEDLDEKIGALETLLLDKATYGSMVCGDGACIGCGEKTVVHLFTATVTALMQPRVKALLEKLDTLIHGLERHVRIKLAEHMNLGSLAAVTEAINEHQEKNLSLAALAAKLGASDDEPIDPEWLQWVTQLIEKLKHLKWQYTHGNTGQGRANLGMVNATGCTSVWGSTFPYAPYPFPWTSNLFQDSPSMAMGLFEGHMAKMAEGFKAIRMAELELAGQYNRDKHDKFFKYFDWKQFSDEEFRLSPPVVSVGGDGAMYDIGFQNLSRMMISGMPIKVLVLDTQVYSNTGGQACTSGFVAQIADMSPYGKRQKGKEEIRKEMSLIAVGHRSTYTLQGSISNITHLLEGYIEGLNSRRPALFNVYAVCQPEHGVADDASRAQSKLAVESRAYPLFKFDPDAGETLDECSTLEGNPFVERDWPSYTLRYEEDGAEKSMELPLTFADFAVTEGRFRKHFKKAPPETWGDEMVALTDFLEMDESEREGLYPYIWTVDGKNRLNRVLVSAEIVESTLERRRFWRQLKSLTGDTQRIGAEQAAEAARVDMARRLTESLLSLATGSGGGNLTAMLSDGAAAPKPGNGANGNGGGFEPVWVETPECTTCDECINIAPKVFQYNDQKKAVVVDPAGAPFKEIVRAAEKCTASCIHPGTPANPAEAGIDKLMKRAEKYQ